MSSWSKRRKYIVAIIFILFIAVVIATPIFLIFYKAPTCFDGKQNGSEQGIDCGGKCTRLCQSEFISPKVAWTRLEEVALGLYNVSAYIINQNPNGEASDVPYRISVYDNKGMLIVVEEGKVTLPPHRNTIAFKGAVSVGKSIPSKVSFEFIQAPNWRKATDTLKNIRIVKKDYSEEGNNSLLEVVLSNDDVLAIKNIGVGVVLYDKDSNAIGFSRTQIDEISPKSDIAIPFTWPKTRSNKVISIEVLPVAE